MNNTFSENNALNHPFSISHGFNSRNKLIKYLNQNGYPDIYGHTLQHRIFNRDLPHIMEFLDILQTDERRLNLVEQWLNWMNWMRDIEVEPTTQKPHYERQEQFDMMNWMKNIEAESTTQKSHDERKREYDRKNRPSEKYKSYLNTAFERLNSYRTDTVFFGYSNSRVKQPRI